MVNMPNFRHAGNFRGRISNKIRRHQECTKMQMWKAAEAYLVELREIINLGSSYLRNNEDPTLEAEIEYGRHYLAQVESSF